MEQVSINGITKINSTRFFEKNSSIFSIFHLQTYIFFVLKSSETYAKKILSSALFKGGGIRISLSRTWWWSLIAPSPHMNPLGSRHHIALKFRVSHMVVLNWAPLYETPLHHIAVTFKGCHMVVLNWGNMMSKGVSLSDDCTLECPESIGKW